MIAALAQSIGSTGMAGGQAIDLESAGVTLSLAQLEDMHGRKTGSLIRASVLLGALARADIAPTQLQTLDRYGQSIGLAFQIMDDILDVEGDAKTLGKTPGMDLTRGKSTFPGLMGMPAAKARTKALHLAALESLAPLGDNGQTLAALAGFIIERTQ